MLTEREKDLQVKNDQLMKILLNQATTVIPLVVNSINFRKAQAIAGDVSARVEIRDLAQALDLDSMRAAAMGIQTPPKDGQR